MAPGIWSCDLCPESYSTRRGFSMHYISCMAKNEKIKKSTCNKTSILIDQDNNDFYCEDCDDNSFSSSNNLHEIHNDTNTIDDESNEFGFKYNVNDSLIHQYEKYINSGIQDFLLDDGEFKSGVMLLSLLRRSKCPLYMFDSIIQWAVESAVNYNVSFDRINKMTREETLNKIVKNYNLENLTPKKTSLNLESAKQPIDVIYFDFEQCLYSILSNKQLMKPENLLDENIENDEILDDLNTGDAFQEGLKIYVKDPEKEKYIPIIFLLTRPILI